VIKFLNYQNTKLMFSASSTWSIVFFILFHLEKLKTLWIGLLARNERHTFLNLNLFISTFRDKTKSCRSHPSHRLFIYHKIIRLSRSLFISRDSIPTSSKLIQVNWSAMLQCFIVPQIEYSCLSRFDRIYAKSDDRKMLNPRLLFYCM